jgi:hypothetical protein
MPGRTTDSHLLVETGLAFGHSGHLSPGVHDCTLPQLRRLVCTNSYRRSLWPRLIAFLTWVILKRQFSHAYVAGGFVSSKKDPHDIDVILQTVDAYGPQSFTALSTFFCIGLEKILSIYSIHVQFWIEGSPSGVADYRTFFQYKHPTRQKELFPAQRGIVRIDLLHPDFIHQLHAAMDPGPNRPPSPVPDDVPHQFPSGD